MAEFTLAPPQSAETIAGFRDGQPWLVLEPTTVRECQKDSGRWLPCLYPEDWHIRSTRERTVPVQVPDPVPCPECWRYTSAYDCPVCPQTSGTGSVQRPLLVPTWQCRMRHDWTARSDCRLVDGVNGHERRLAGVVLHPNPVYLPVVDDNTEANPDGKFIMVYSGDYDGTVYWWNGAEDDMGTDITDQFSTPPPVGALLVDMTDAVWLEGDDVVTEMVCPHCNGHLGDPDRLDEAFWFNGCVEPGSVPECPVCDGQPGTDGYPTGRVPLSASTTQLTTITTI